jgi:hypothetical protein
MKGGVTRHEAMMMSALERKEHLQYLEEAYKRRAEAMTGQEFM